MEDRRIKVLKDELESQIHSNRTYQFPEDIISFYSKRNKVSHADQSVKSLDNDFYSIISAKNEWETCVDSLENKAVVILDRNLKVIRVNKTIELWGWGSVEKVKGMHILDLIKPEVENGSVNDWFNEWCLEDTKTNVEWVSNNYKSDRTFRFSYYPNKDSTNIKRHNDCYTVMLITDISNQKILGLQNNHLTCDRSSTNTDETDYIRLPAYRLHQLADRLVRSQEDERKRISSELHDGVGQLLSSLKYQVELAVIEANDNSQISKNNNVLNDILKNTTFALSELRRVSTNLRPSIITDLGILMTLEWFTNEYNKIYTYLNIDLQIDILEFDIPDKTKSVIYRVVQESMNNIAKHSDGKNISINLTKSESGFLLCIRDDGCGFDLKKVKKTKKSGLGLESMEERAINSGANFLMTSNSLSGTTIQLYWSDN